MRENTVIRSNRYTAGREGEALAADYLCQLGYFIAARNYQSPYGEIDIIAENTQYVRFVEVKLRRGAADSLPREYVDKYKQERIIRSAKNYIYRSRTRLTPRFDVVEIILAADGDFKNADVHYIEDAFGVKGNEFY